MLVSRCLPSGLRRLRFIFVRLVSGKPDFDTESDLERKMDSVAAFPIQTGRSSGWSSKWEWYVYGASRLRSVGAWGLYAG